MDIKEKLTATARRYSKKIAEEFYQTAGRNVQLNSYISGSVSYGFCDEMSDIEMEFYLPNELKSGFKSKLKKIIDAHKDFDGIRISAGVSDWPLEMIAHGEMEEFWKQSYTYLLYELTHAIPVKEDLPLIDTVKSKISFYPQPVLQRIIKGLWLTIGDNGTYNANWSFKRSQNLASNIFLFISIEAILRLAYLLNNKYFPHTKWLEKELPDLENDFGLVEFVKKSDQMTQKEKLSAHDEIVKKMDIFMTEKSILKEELINDPWSIVHEDYYVFNPMRFGWDELKHSE